MSKNQMKFDFHGLKVGDLVKQNATDVIVDKKYGVIVEIDPSMFENQVKVHWLNYGSFWTLSDKLIKMNKNEKV
jgi:hypothetical protein